MKFQEDDEFELITKSELHKLREELHKLKENKEKLAQIQNKEITNSQGEYFKRTNEEINALKKEVIQTKELCKKILDINLNEKSNSNKINEIIASLREMTQLIRLMVEILENNKKTDSIPQDLITRLDNIEKFMNQLTIYLTRNRY